MLEFVVVLLVRRIYIVAEGCEPMFVQLANVLEMIGIALALNKYTN